MESLFANLRFLKTWSSLNRQQKLQVGDYVLRYFGPDYQDRGAIAALAQALADSGEMCSWPAEMHPVCDVASTGGPSSLSTLLCPYIVAAVGQHIPNITVPGSLAGATDVLGLIAGYRVQLNQSEMLHALRSSRIAHTLTTASLAPADGYIFALRKRRKKKAVPALVVASILSKKVAAAIDYCVLDIRCGASGNVGATLDECKRNAEMFVQVANIFRIFQQ